MPQVFTARVHARHDELDAFGRVAPAAYLRYLAQVAVDASAAAGFDARWYAENGVHWLVRRTTFALHVPAGAGAALDVRTWVEDFRRVRSQRRYAVRDAGGAPVLDATTDWVLVESASGKLRRVPEAMERQFGTSGAHAAPRAPWTAPPAPATPLRTSYAVRYSDLDSLAHVNNAAYLDVLTQAALDALAQLGWGHERLLEGGAAPLCVRGDLEYLDAAVLGDTLAAATWLTPGDGEVGVHQLLTRASDERDLVRFTGAWRWLDVATRAPASPPDGLARAVAEAVAA